MYTNTHREGRDSKRQAAVQSRVRLRQRRSSQMQQLLTHTSQCTSLCGDTTVFVILCGGDKAVQVFKHHYMLIFVLLLKLNLHHLNYQDYNQDVYSKKSFKLVKKKKEQCDTKKPSFDYTQLLINREKLLHQRLHAN